MIYPHHLKHSVKFLHHEHSVFTLFHYSYVLNVFPDHSKCLMIGSCFASSLWEYLHSNLPWTLKNQDHLGLCCIGNGQEFGLKLAWSIYFLLPLSQEQQREERCKRWKAWRKHGIWADLSSAQVNEHLLEAGRKAGCLVLQQKAGSQV